jgi:hypothetical protein
MSVLYQSSQNSSVLSDMTSKLLTYFTKGWHKIGILHKKINEDWHFFTLTTKHICNFCLSSFCIIMSPRHFCLVCDESRWCQDKCIAFRAVAVTITTNVKFLWLEQFRHIWSTHWSLRLNCTTEFSSTNHDHRY